MKKEEGWPELSAIDYHNWTHRGTPKETRKKLNIGDIYLNAAECNECGHFIRSRNRYDYVSCKCGQSFVDGGSFYQRSNTNCKSIIEYYDDIELEDEETETV